MDQATALPFDYIGSALCTKSDKFHGELMPYQEFMQTLGACIVALNKLDIIKKTLFYGRDYPTGIDRRAFENCANIVKGWSQPTLIDKAIREAVPTKITVDIVHAILGKATESGELLELLNNSIRTGNFDPVNFKEEMFDGQWYDAIGCNAIGVTFEEGQQNNIAKLRKRFGDKFTEYDANNRDLDAEREVLEISEETAQNTVRQFIGGGSL